MKTPTGKLQWIYRTDRNDPINNMLDSGNGYFNPTKEKILQQQWQEDTFKISRGDNGIYMDIHETPRTKTWWEDVPIGEAE